MEDVETKIDQHVPFYSGYTLHQNTSIAYRYASGVAFVRRGRTEDVGGNSDVQWDRAPSGVNLIDI